MPHIPLLLMLACAVVGCATYRHANRLWFTVPNYTVQERRLSGRQFWLLAISLTSCIFYTWAAMADKLPPIAAWGVPLLYIIYCVVLAFWNKATASQEPTWPRRPA